MTNGTNHCGDPTVAVLHIRGHDGTFVAGSCEIANGLITATGRTRRSSGAGFAEYRWGPRARFSWPTRKVERIDWALDPTDGEAQ